MDRSRLTVAQAVAVVALAAAAGCGGARRQAGDGSSTAAATSTTASAQIVVQQPHDGDHVRRSLRVAGTAQVNEGSVSVVLAGSDGRTLVQTTMQAACGAVCRGPFQGRLTVPDGYRGPATLRLFEASAEDGSPLHEVDVHLTVA